MQLTVRGQEWFWKNYSMTGQKSNVNMSHCHVALYTVLYTTVASTQAFV